MWNKVSLEFNKVSLEFNSFLFLFNFYYIFTVFISFFSRRWSEDQVTNVFPKKNRQRRTSSEVPFSLLLWLDDGNMVMVPLCPLWRCSRSRFLKTASEPPCYSGRSSWAHVSYCPLASVYDKHSRRSRKLKMAK